MCVYVLYVCVCELIICPVFLMLRYVLNIIFGGMRTSSDNTATDS